MLITLFDQYFLLYFWGKAVLLCNAIGEIICFNKLKSRLHTTFSHITGIASCSLCLPHFLEHRQPVNYEYMSIDSSSDETDTSILLVDHYDNETSLQNILNQPIFPRNNNTNRRKSSDECTRQKCISYIICGLYILFFLIMIFVFINLGRLFYALIQLSRFPLKICEFLDVYHPELKANYTACRKFERIGFTFAPPRSRT